MWPLPSDSTHIKKTDSLTDENVDAENISNFCNIGTYINFRLAGTLLETTPTLSVLSDLSTIHVSSGTCYVHIGKCIDILRVRKVVKNCTNYLHTDRQPTLYVIAWVDDSSIIRLCLTQWCQYQWWFLRKVCFIKMNKNSNNLLSLNNTVSS